MDICTHLYAKDKYPTIAAAINHYKAQHNGRSPFNYAFDRLQRGTSHKILVEHAGIHIFRHAGTCKSPCIITESEQKQAA